MTNKVNPFTPNNPVHRDMFKGRVSELEAIDRALRQAKNGNPTQILLIGERGIGKTSLLNVAGYFARGEISLNGDAQPHNFLTLKVSLDGGMDLTDLAVNLKNCLERELDKINTAAAFIKKTWNFVSKFEVGGISYKSEEREKNNAQIINDFIYSLVDTIKSLRSDNSELGGNKKDGLVILIDEADKASEKLNLGTFLKNLSEVLASEECNYLSIILCGLPNLRDILAKSHESSLRLFQEFTLNPLSKKETQEVIQGGLDESKRLNDQEILIESEALESMYVFSEGYPHFVQQIGYSVHEINEDNNISEEDVEKGMFMPNGALQQIGDRYYVKPFYRDINVDSQREILTIMAENWNQWVTRETIKSKFSGKGAALDNGIRALREKNIIIPREGHKGQYRLQWASFAFWIKNHKKTERRH